MLLFNCVENASQSQCLQVGRQKKNINTKDQHQHSISVDKPHNRDLGL